MRINEYAVLLNEGRVPYLSKISSKNETIVDAFDMPCKFYDFFTKSDGYNLSNLAEEHVYMITLDTKNKPIGIFLISKGTINNSLLSTSDVLKRALLSNATSIVIVHNHPSGSCVPSSSDYAIEKKLKEACKIMDIGFLDFLIIGDNYYSFREENEL